MTFGKSVAAAGLVAALLVNANANAAIVTNGSFETGDFTGWTTNPVSFPIYIVTSPVANGTYAAQIAGYDSGLNTLSQTITTTVGQNYLLSFSYYQVMELPNFLGVTWNGASVYSATNDLVSGYQGVVATVTGTGSDSLMFTAYNNPAYTYLDNVTLSAVPEPATWAMMLVGFGGLGAAMRSRRRSIKVAA